MSSVAGSPPTAAFLPLSNIIDVRDVIDSENCARPEATSCDGTITEFSMHVVMSP